jgi:hypothetical protein
MNETNRTLGLRVLLNPRPADKGVKIMRKWLLLIGCALLSSAAQAGALKGQELAAAATVSLETARSIALKVRPGTITDEELEREKGGSGLRYSFDIKVGGQIYEVGVDAKSGKVLENALEGANPD